jgi:hypothetical protein
MTHRLALLASLMLVAATPCGAQSPASDAPATSATPAAKPASSTASSSPTAPVTAPAGTDSTAAASKPASSATDASSSEPSPEVLKEARREGFKVKKRDGVTKYCYSDATLGTRFETEKCYDQQHMEMLVQQRQDQRNQLGQPAACTGSACSGK